MLISIATFNYETYTPQRWHSTLVMWAVVIIPFIFNLWFRKFLNTFEIAGGICHAIFFIVSMGVLIGMGKRTSTDYVFKTLTHDLSGWNNPGVAWSLGLLTVTFSMSGRLVSHTILKIPG
jgi:choline transport protein